MTRKDQEISLVIAGEAGQGIQTIGNLLTKLLHQRKYNVFSTKEYMSRVRGGSNSIEIRIAHHPVYSFIDRIDLLIVLDEKAFDHISHRITDETRVIGDRSIVKNLSHPHLYSLDLIKEAKNIGNTIYANTIIIGFLAFLFHIPTSVIEKEIQSFFNQKPKKIIEHNIQAIQKGKKIADNISDNIIPSYIPPLKNPKKEKLSTLLLNGTQAIGLGALAGGCHFISSYPMSPSTGVLTFLATHEQQADVLVEQAEDEIAAVNMALGAWYAGTRALVTTSGGGFALMGEGISLAAMTETPLVIHLAQRPGPATGLPTRTEQADLQLALYSGHGEFPRVIYAPGTLQQGFQLTKKAFDIADEYQIPVIILTDQYYVDSTYQTPPFPTIDESPGSHIIETSEDYQRYQDNKNKISPRGIPGNGKGLICVDSDEHDKTGRITERATMRKHMVEKRLQKTQLLQKNSIPPSLTGPKNYKILLVGWGSTKPVIQETMKQLPHKNLSFLHFSQVYPLHEKTKHYLQKATHIISIENNATAQFAQLLKQQTGETIDAHILQYTGHPFSVETLTEKITETIQSMEEQR